MATTQNAGDLLLASTSPRMETWYTTANLDFSLITGTTKPADNATKNIITYGPISSRPVGTNGDIHYATDTSPPTEYKKISGNWVQSSTANTGLFAVLSGTVNSSNYATYLSDGAVTVRAFAQNVGSAAATQQASVTLSPDTRDVIINVGGLVIGATAGSGNTYGILSITENGSYFVDHRVVANFPNSDLTRPAQICVNHSLFRSSTVPSGSTTYEITLSASPNPAGSTGELVRWAYIQVLVLKR